MNQDKVDAMMRRTAEDGETLTMADLVNLIRHQMETME